MQIAGDAQNPKHNYSYIFITLLIQILLDISFDFTKAEINYGKEVATLCGICRGTKNAL